MKIYVSLPLDFEEEDMKAFVDGVNHLKKLGHNVVDTTGHNAKSKENAEKLFSHSDKSLKDTDIVIAEVSKSDSKVGYEIAKAFNEKKFVIALENEEATEQVNPIVHGNKSKNLMHTKYHKKNITTVIENTVKEAAKRLDSKFILIISPEIDRYLDWSSTTKRMHKAQIVRNALEQMMKKDKDYKNYLNS
jgi:nucleoside 2-deoxyribosyltransferase